MTRPFLITGRNVSNWLELGHEVPADVTRLACCGCGVMVTISAGGALIMAEHKLAGGFCGAVCGGCALAAATTLKGMEVKLSPAGVELIERNRGAREFVDLLRETARGREQPQ